MSSNRANELRASAIRRRARFPIARATRSRNISACVSKPSLRWRDRAFPRCPCQGYTLPFAVRCQSGTLKYRHHAARRLPFGCDHSIDFGEGADNRLLADDFLAGRQCRQNLRKVERRRSTDVDDVDIIHAQHFVEGSVPPNNRELITELGEPPFIAIAQRDHLQFFGMYP